MFLRLERKECRQNLTVEGKVKTLLHPPQGLKKASASAGLRPLLPSTGASWPRSFKCAGKPRVWSPKTSGRGGRRWFSQVPHHRKHLGGNGEGSRLKASLRALCSSSGEQAGACSCGRKPHRQNNGHLFRRGREEKKALPPPRRKTVEEISFATLAFLARAPRQAAG